MGQSRHRETIYVPQSLLHTQLSTCHSDIVSVRVDAMEVFIWKSVSWSNFDYL